MSASLAGQEAGVWAAAAPLGVPSGKIGRHPSGADGDPPRSYPGRAPTPFLGSPDRRRHASALPAGFSPARGVINVPPPAPVRCACAGSSQESETDDRHRRFERWRCACPRPRPPCTPTRTPPYGEAGLNSVLPVTKSPKGTSLNRITKSSNSLVKSTTVPIRPQKSFFVAQLSPTRSVNTPHDHTTRPVAI